MNIDILIKDGIIEASIKDRTKNKNDIIYWNYKKIKNDIFT